MNAWSPLHRALAAVAALLSWLALALQFYFSIRISLGRGATVGHGIWMYFGFFTILTNILVAVVLTAPLVSPDSRLGRTCSAPTTVAGVAVNIALVGIVYNLLLRNVWHPQGLQYLNDVLLHDAVPVLFLGYSWLNAGIGVVTFAARAAWGVWPIAYFAYVLVRGSLSGFYPYPFINVAQLGYGRVLVNAILIFAGYLLIAALLAGLERLHPARAVVANADRQG